MVLGSFFYCKKSSGESFEGQRPHVFVFLDMILGTNKGIIPHEVGCLSNGTTNAIRYYLRAASVNPDRFTISDVLYWTKEFLKHDLKSKPLAHVLFFLHLDLPELEGIKTIPDYFALVNVDYDPIMPSYYICAVFDIGLHEYFLQMASTLGHLEFARNLLTMAVDRIVTVEQLSTREWLLYLTTTGRLRRINPHNDFYQKMFDQLLKAFINLPYTVKTAIARADVLLRLAGILSLTKEDYEGSSEIADSIRELKFDPTFCPPQPNEMDTSGAFESMFGCQKIDFSTFPQLQDEVLLIGDYLNKLQFTKGEEESLKRLNVLPKKYQKVIHYIGDCAYLTSLIVKKNLPALCSPSTSTGTSLLYFTAYMEQFKSKIRCEDYDTRNMKFSDFSIVLRSSKLKYAHHQTSWFEKFLNYEEGLTTQEGYSLANEVIVPRVDLQIGLQMVKKISKMYLAVNSLEEELKEILLALVITNENLNKEFDQIVHLLLKREIHTGFCTMGFQAELNDVCSKLGADASFDTTTQKLSISCIRGCQRVALQNPKVACQTLLLRTMQLPKGGLEVLEALRCFWNLSVTSDEVDDGVSNLFDYCLKKICSLVTDDTMRNMQTKLSKFAPQLLRHHFITVDKFAAIIHKMIISFNKTESNEKIGLLVEIYASLVTFVIEEQTLSHKSTTVQGSTHPNRQQFIREAYYRLSGLSIAATWSKAMDIYAVRDKCIEICDKLTKTFHSLFNLVPAEKMMEKFDETTLGSKILVYVRKSEFRQKFQELLKNDSFVAQHDSPPTSKDVANYIRNTSPLEWDDLIEILYQVFLHFSRNDKCSNNDNNAGVVDCREVAFQQLFAVLQKVPAFELPTAHVEACQPEEDDKKKQTLSRRSQENIPSVIYQRFAHHLVYSIEKGHGAFIDFSHRHKEQYDLVYAFVSLIANYPDDREYTRVKQLTFISLLHLAIWIVKSKSDYETKLKSRILECLDEIKDDEENGKHGSIFASIITVFKKTEPQAQSIIPIEWVEIEGSDTEEMDHEFF